MEVETSQFVTVAVNAVLQTVEVSTSPDGDSGQLKTVDVDTVFHSVDVRTPSGGPCEDGPGLGIDSVNCSGFAAGAWICPSAI